MTPIKTLYLARDTTSTCLFENPPVREIYENGFAFTDNKSKWYSELTGLDNEIKIGEVFELPLIKKDFFDEAISVLDFLRKMFTI